MRHEREHEPFAEWSALAAVGALDGAERARFEAHLAGGCAACEANLLEGTRVVAALAWALPDAPLRPEVRDRLMARVAAEARPGTSFGVASTMSRGSMSRGRGRPPSDGPGVGRGGWSLPAWRPCSSGGSTTPGRRSSPRAPGSVCWSGSWSRSGPSRHSWPTPTHTSPRSGVWMRPRVPTAGSYGVRRSARASWSFTTCRCCSPGQRYHLWTVGDSAWAPAGTFEVDHIGHAALTVRVERERPERFAVTVELEGPRTAPRGPTVMQGAPSG